VSRHAAPDRPSVHVIWTSHEKIGRHVLVKLNQTKINDVGALRGTVRRRRIVDALPASLLSMRRTLPNRLSAQLAGKSIAVTGGWLGSLRGKSMPMSGKGP
jgi:hypothetical protein